jgi:anti-sigma B factor antagonist
MDILTTSQGAVTVLKPNGPLAAADADGFSKLALAEAVKQQGRIVVDATAVPFLDSRGIEVLIDVSEAMGQSGRALKLCGANQTVRRVLEITGWAGSLEFFDDVNAGVRSFL